MQEYHVHIVVNRPFDFWVFAENEEGAMRDAEQNITWDEFRSSSSYVVTPVRKDEAVSSNIGTEV